MDNSPVKVKRRGSRGSHDEEFVCISRTRSGDDIQKNYCANCGVLLIDRSCCFNCGLSGGSPLTRSNSKNDESDSFPIRHIDSF